MCYKGLAAGQHAAEDADSATQDQDTGRHKQDRSSGDGGGHVDNVAHHSGDDSAEVIDHRGHGRSSSSLQNHPLHYIPKHLDHLFDYPKGKDRGKKEGRSVEVKNSSKCGEQK